MISTPRGDILHTVQGQYHATVPATALDVATEWIERRHGATGFDAIWPRRGLPGRRVTHQHE